MTLLAAFQTLLYRYSGQTDICVGTPIANRTRAECENLIGFFVNTLVLRTDLADEPGFRVLLERVREITLAAYAHQDLPFEMLVDELHIERDLSRTPLFQVMFVMQNAPTETLTLPGVTLSRLEVDSGTSKFDLSLVIEEEGQAGGLSGMLIYNTDLFDAATITRMIGHFQTLLAGIAADPDQSVATLPLLTEAERRQILVEWNATRTDDPPAACVQHLFEAQAERTPDAVAVISGTERLTYRELNTRANRLAHRLRRLGVGPETLVGVCSEHALDMVISLLGILKAGGAYLPLDPTYPAERLAFMLEDSQAPVVITHGTTGPRAGRDGPPTLVNGQWSIVRLDADWPTSAQEPESNPVSAVTPEHLAYVIYTSGSTGQPKGVMIEHQAIANHCRDVLRHYQLTASDCVLQFASFNFDASIEQILPALICGARLVLRGTEVWDPAEFHAKVAEYGLTVINPPTAYWHQIAQAWAARPEVVPSGQLRLVIAGGDTMQPAGVRLWQQTPARAARLLNAYGPTETTITATTFDVPLCADGDVPVTRIPIGRPLPNRTTYILDRRGNPVPIGVPGELHLGGAGLARGYLNRPELTAQKFVPNPFAGGAMGRWGNAEMERWGDTPIPPISATAPQLHTSTAPHLHTPPRLYRTGDLARYRPDGSIEFLGRVDQQVKLRGFRIEPGEIETVLRQHLAVQDTLVLAREDVPGDKRLVAYVVVTTDDRPRTTDHGRPTTDDRPPTAGSAASRQVAVGASELRNFLKARLPDYMLPAAFVMLDAFPLTPSGKVDRRALPVPEAARPDVNGSHVAPRTPTEAALAAIWIEVLPVEQVSIHDNFFELGGHSLLATQLMARVRKAFQVEVPLRQLFEAPTVAGLATLIAQRQAEQADHDALARLLVELEQLSDDEARGLLANQTLLE